MTHPDERPLTVTQRAYVACFTDYLRARRGSPEERDARLWTLRHLGQLLEEAGLDIPELGDRRRRGRRGPYFTRRLEQLRKAIA